MPEASHPDDRAARRATHVAVIMDGNGRWAEERGLQRSDGHTTGEEVLEDIVRAASDLELGWITFFGFSTENWSRPDLEVRHIIAMHEKVLNLQTELMERNMRLRWAGCPPETPESRSPELLVQRIHEVVALTEGNTGTNLTIAFDYGGRTEIVHAARRLAAQVTDPAEVTDAALSAHMYVPEMPPVDLYVRTSGEHRISNFLLWQAPGAEFVSLPEFWPEFTRERLTEVVAAHVEARRAKPTDH